jgi:hypothetical protein
MSDPFPPSTPDEPRPGGATPAGTPPPGGYPPATGGTGGGSSPDGPALYPPTSGQSGFATSDVPPEPVFANPTDVPGPPPKAPPSAPAAGTGRPASSMTGDQVKVAFQNANRLDLGIIAAGLLAFILSLFSYYTVSVKGFGGLGQGSLSVWHGFFGWFGVLLALGGAVLVALPLLGVRLGIPTRLAALAAFAAATLCTLIALFVDPASGGSVLDIGRGFGYWATLLCVVAGTVLCVMRKDAVD